METYSVFCVSETEYAKADDDWSYAPAEHFVGNVRAESERQADKLAKRRFGSSAMVRLAD